jgi:hypothetical protein
MLDTELLKHQIKDLLDSTTDADLLDLIYKLLIYEKLS